MNGGITIRIAIFEDDPVFAARLESIVRQHTHQPSILNTGDADVFLRQIERMSEPALCFLDIVAEGEPVGLSLARRLAGQPGALIAYITSYPRHIRHDPYCKVGAFSAILKVGHPDIEREVADTIQLAEQALSERCLLVHDGRFETLYIPYESILYIEAVKGSKRLRVCCIDGQHIIRGTLSGLLPTLPANFLQCHRSIIVNRAQITGMDKRIKVLRLSNGTSCPYSPWRMGGEHP